MSTTDTPDGTNFPTSITIPSDGDGPLKAADVNTAFEGLNDRTEHLHLSRTALADVAALRAINTTGLANGLVRHTKAFGIHVLDTSSASAERVPWIVKPTTGPGRWIASAASVLTELDQLALLPALNFLGPVTPGGATNGEAAYDPFNRLWYVCGNTENVRSSSDHGRTWSGASLVAAVLANENCLRIAVNPATGDVIVATDTRYIAEMTGSTGVWTKVDVFGVAAEAIACPVAWDPIHSRWFWITPTTSLSPAGLYSSNRTTWANSTMSTNWTTGQVNQIALAVKPSTGRIVMMGRRTAVEALLPATSDDGGVTWMDRAGLTNTVPSPTTSWMTYHADRDTWLFGIGETSGAHSSDIWRSTDDGVTWTKVSSLTATCIEKAAPIGVVDWVAVDAAFVVLISRDNGATWKRTNYLLDTASATRGIFAGNGGLLALTGTMVQPSLRTGGPFNAVT